MSWQVVALVLGLVWAAVAVFAVFMYASLHEPTPTTRRQEVV